MRERDVRQAGAGAGLGVRDALVFGYGAAVSIFLAFLLWKYVPLKAAAFADSGAQLSLPTRVVITASMWFVRLLPLLVLAAIPAAVVTLLLALWLGTARPRVLRVFLVAYGLAVSATCALVLAAM